MRISNPGLNVQLEIEGWGISEFRFNRTSELSNMHSNKKPLRIWKGLKI